MLLQEQGPALNYLLNHLTNMNRVKITIGDWSRDGHENYDELVFESNKTVEEIRQAYKDSCKLTGIQFNDMGNNNYTDLTLTWQDPEYDTRQIAVDYEENTVSKLAHDELWKHGLDTNNYANEDAKLHDQYFLNLLIDFIKLSIPDLLLEEASFKKSELKDIPAVNGWWNSELNVAWGYGLYE